LKRKEAEGKEGEKEEKKKRRTPRFRSRIVPANLMSDKEKKEGEKEKKRREKSRSSLRDSTTRSLAALEWRRRKKRRRKGEKVASFRGRFNCYAGKNEADRMGGGKKEGRGLSLINFVINQSPLDSTD